MSAAPPIASAVPKTPSDLRQALAQFGRELSAGLWVAQSATIAAFSAGPPQLADVTLNSAIVVGWKTNPSGGAPTPVLKKYPTFAKVPVIFPGGGGAALTFPVAAGDTCLLVFLDRDQDNWLTSGQTGLPPNSARLHAPSDAVCFVGLRNNLKGLPGFSTTDAQLYGTSGPTGPRVSIDATKIQIANATQSLLTIMDSLFTALINATVQSHPFDAGTVTALQTAKTNFDALFKT